MKTITRVLTLIYSLAGLAYILMEEGNATTMRFVIKDCLIPFLIIIFIINLRHDLKGINLLVFAGLVFSWAGDIIIDYSFIFGLVGFLMAHVMYLTAFFLTPGRNVIFRERIFILIPILLAGALLIYILNDDLGDMRVPVVIYAAVILTMLASAFNRVNKVNRQSYWLVLAGAFLFVISDSAIAINRFTWDFNYSGPIIMSTYLAAQYLITIGYISQFSEKPY